MTTTNANYAHLISIDTVIHQFKVNYTKAKGIDDAQRHVDSSIFKLHGHKWFIRFMPRGIYKEDKGFASLYLAVASESDKEIDISFDFHLLDQDRNPPPNAAHLRIVCTFESQWTWVYSYSINRDELEAKFVNPFGCFLGFCKIRGINGSSYLDNEPAEEPCLKLPSYNIKFGTQLVDLMKNNEMTDVFFDIKGEKFSAHRLVLALKSPVFKAQLFGPMAERGTKMNPIKINDIEPVVFECLLEYMYTDSLPKQDSIFVTYLLLETADKYLMERLKSTCEEIISEEHIGVDKVLDTLALAEQHNCARLKEACIKAIAKPKNRLILDTTKDYIDLMQSSACLQNELQALISHNPAYNSLSETRCVKTNTMYYAFICLGFFWILGAYFGKN